MGGDRLVHANTAGLQDFPLALESMIAERFVVAGEGEVSQRVDLAVVHFVDVFGPVDRAQLLSPLGRQCLWHNVFDRQGFG